MPSESEIKSSTEKLHSGLNQTGVASLSTLSIQCVDGYKVDFYIIYFSHQT